MPLPLAAGIIPGLIAWIVAFFSERVVAKAALIAAYVAALLALAVSVRLMLNVIVDGVEMAAPAQLVSVIAVIVPSQWSNCVTAWLLIAAVAKSWAYVNRILAATAS